MKVRNKKISGPESARAAHANNKCISSVTTEASIRCPEKTAEALFALPYWIRGASVHGVRSVLSSVEGVLTAAVIFNASVVRVHYDSRRTDPGIIGRALSTACRNRDNLFHISFDRIHQADLYPVEEKNREC